MAPGQVTFSGTMLPAFMFSPFGVQYGGSYTGTLGGGAGKDRAAELLLRSCRLFDTPRILSDHVFWFLLVAQSPMQAYMSRMFFMLGTMILVGILLY